MKIFNLMSEFDYEQLVFCNDEKSGLKAIVCIHNSTLGPALGGLRYYEYPSEEEAIIDVVRLARGMTYKNAAAGVNLGGAKAVLIKDPNKPKSEAMLKAFARFVEGLNGRYITAEDVGTTEDDMDIILSETDYVVGTSLRPKTSGNPSPVTAHGVYVGIKAACKEAFGSDSLEGKKILVEGIGNVGMNVVREALEEGALVYVSDINEKSIEEALSLGAQRADQDPYAMDIDIYSPCAMGASINDSSLAKLKAKVVAGSANNQLAEERHGEVLKEKKIVYAPDFIINSGGVINVADELYGGYNPERAMRTVEKIYDKLGEIFEIAREENISTNKAAERLAERRLEEVLNTKRIFVNDNKNILKF